MLSIYNVLFSIDNIDTFKCHLMLLFESQYQMTHIDQLKTNIIVLLIIIIIIITFNLLKSNILSDSISVCSTDPCTARRSSI